MRRPWNQSFEPCSDTETWSMTDNVKFGNEFGSIWTERTYYIPLDICSRHCDIIEGIAASAVVDSCAAAGDLWTRTSSLAYHELLYRADRVFNRCPGVQQCNIKHRYLTITHHVIDARDVFGVGGGQPWYHTISNTHMEQCLGIVFHRVTTVKRDLSNTGSVTWPIPRSSVMPMQSTYEKKA